MSLDLDDTAVLELAEQDVFGNKSVSIAEADMLLEQYKDVDTRIRKLEMLVGSLNQSVKRIEAKLSRSVKQASSLKTMTDSISHIEESIKILKARST
ncbi:hypothetical protein HC928_03650 [bacterium]|nr:hypothetical protein [bacterium]